MFHRFGTGLAILAAAGMLLVVACSDDDDTTPTPTTTQTTSAGGSGGAAGMTCEEACAELYTCGQAECPDWEAGDPTEEDWLNGPNGNDGCLANCAASPALIALVNPDDCATTVGTLATVNPDFDESCNGAGTGGGPVGGSGGAATGGSGGAATGGSGGAATGGSGGGN